MSRQICRFLDLGAMEPVATQAIYEAVATERRNETVDDTLIICWPRSPLVCIGYFQEVEKELDISYCEKKRIPIVRRILGGGAVYLDSNQVFYQIVGERGGKVVPGDIDAIFRKMLDAPVRVYKEMGIPAVYKPVNDIEVAGRKISGNGAGEVDGIAILTGNIIVDFNYDEMTRILKVPDEKFRDKLTKSLRERVTSVKRELGFVPNHEEVKASLVRHFAETIGVEIAVGSLTKEEDSLLKRLVRDKYLSREWTYENSERHPGLLPSRTVKISGRSVVGQGVHKSPGGLIRITGEFVDNRIRDILISGDFTFLPAGKLAEMEKMLVGRELNEIVLLESLDEFYRANRIEAPGTTPSDFKDAVLIASGTSR